MNTLVVIETPRKLVRLMLSELITVPAKGVCYLLNGECLEVTDTLEVLGAEGALGSKMNGEDRLKELIQAVYGGNDVDVAAKIAGIVNITALTSEKGLARVGTIVTLDNPLEIDFDNALFVRTRSSRKYDSAVSPTVRLQIFADDTDGSGDDDHATEDPVVAATA